MSFKHAKNFHDERDIFQYYLTSWNKYNHAENILGEKNEFTVLHIHIFQVICCNSEGENIFLVSLNHVTITTTL